MKVITEINVNKIINVDPYNQKFICLISIMEAFINLVSKDCLEIVQKKSKEDITLRELGVFYNYKLKNNDGIHGVCWEYAVYYGIYYNDEFIQDLLNTSINYLCNKKSYRRLNAILWGGEKNNLPIQNIKDSLEDDDVIWTPEGKFNFKDYIDMISLSFRKKDIRNNLPKSINGIWRTDLFVKKEDSNEWYSVTVKWNKYEIKYYSGLSIGISFENKNKVRYSENPKLVSNNFVYCSIPVDLNFGQYFAYIFRLFESTLKVITDSKIKNSIRFDFSSPEEFELFNFLYTHREYTVFSLINFLKEKYCYYNKKTSSTSEILEATDRIVNLNSLNINEINNKNGIIFIPK